MTRAMTPSLDMKWLHVLAASTFLAASVPSMELLAQGLESKQAIDAIIGSDVEEEEVPVAADQDRVIAAIEKAAEAAAIVRKLTSLDKVDIVFLSDAAVTEGGLPAEIQAKMDANSAAVTQLRQELEGSAMLFHAIDSRGVLIRDVVGVEFDARTAVIFAAAKPPAAPLR